MAQGGRGVRVPPFLISFGCGLLVNLVTAGAALLVADEWDSGGTEAATTMVLGAVALTGLLGITALVRGRRAAGGGLLAAAVLAPVLDVFAFYFFVLVISGQSLS